MRTRITPACAGRTFFRNIEHRIPGDHPRVCGKNTAIRRLCKGGGGSPPRVREEHIAALPPRRFQGITPACAGRTLTQCGACGRSQDHPRVCGKNDLSLGLIDKSIGSPPRVREELPPSCLLPLVLRITPACAGRTLRDCLLVLMIRDHPRVCGKNRMIHRIRGLWRGSPPRVWEEPKIQSRLQIHKRITPACAGRTPCDNR